MSYPHYTQKWLRKMEVAYRHEFGAYFKTKVIHVVPLSLTQYRNISSMLSTKPMVSGQLDLKCKVVEVFFCERK